MRTRLTKRVSKQSKNKGQALLKEYLNMAEIAIQDFSEANNFSPGMISLYHNGARRPSVQRAKEIETATSGLVPWTAWFESAS